VEACERLVRAVASASNSEGDAQAARGPRSWPGRPHSAGSTAAGGRGAAETAPRTWFGANGRSRMRCGRLKHPNPKETDSLTGCLTSGPPVHQSNSDGLGLAGRGSPPAGRRLRDAVLSRQKRRPQVRVPSIHYKQMQQLRANEAKQRARGRAGRAGRREQRVVRGRGGADGQRRARHDQLRLQPHLARERRERGAAEPDEAQQRAGQRAGQRQAAARGGGSRGGGGGGAQEDADAGAQQERDKLGGDAAGLINCGWRVGELVGERNLIGRRREGAAAAAVKCGPHNGSKAVTNQGANPPDLLPLGGPHLRHPEPQQQQHRARPQQRRGL
jgi:hypothetical protein